MLSRQINTCILFYFHMGMTVYGSLTVGLMLLCDDGQKEEKTAEGKKGGGKRFQNSRTSGMTIDLWWALWAAGVGSVVGSERLGGRGHRAEGWRGWKATTAGLWFEIGVSWQAH